MSFRQNINQQLRDAGYDDIADAVELLLSDTIPSSRNAPLTITVNESIVDFPISGYGSDVADPTSEFRETSDPLPDPGKPGRQARHDVSSLQVSQYATRRGFDNDVQLSPPKSL